MVFKATLQRGNQTFFGLFQWKAGAPVEAVAVPDPDTAPSGTDPLVRWAAGSAQHSYFVERYQPDPKGPPGVRLCEWDGQTMRQAPR